MSISTHLIYFITCHAAPAEHFAVYAEELKRQNFEIKVIASEAVQGKFKDSSIRIETFNLNDKTPEEKEALAAQLAKSCSVATTVITDVGDLFATQLQKALQMISPHVLRCAYYDNPESSVPGDYLMIAFETMRLANRILFANANLPQSNDLIEEKGLGYYPIHQSAALLQQRKDHQKQTRAAFFENYHLGSDTGQLLLVYFGGNNEEYFSEAFPAFVDFLQEKQTELKDVIVILQQHPRAKALNRDRTLLESQQISSLKIVVSNESTEMMKCLADGGLYHQTSMGPLLLLAGIPLMQVGKKPSADLLIREKVCLSATDSEAFVQGIHQMQQPQELTEEKRQAIYQALGVREDWQQRLAQAVVLDL